MVTIWGRFSERGRGHAIDFYSDLRKVWHASKTTFFFLLAVEIFLGLALMIELAIVGGLVDALIAARSARIVTTEVGRYAWYQIALFIALLPALIVHHQFEGISARIGSRIREGAFLLGSFFVALPVAPMFLVFAPVFAVIVWFTEHRYATWIFSAGILTFASLRFYDLLVAVIYRATTIGNVLFWGGALMAMAGYLALRPYLYSKF